MSHIKIDKKRFQAKFRKFEQSSDDKSKYNILLKCFRRTAEKHNITLIETLHIADKYYPKLKLREVFVKLDEKYRSSPPKTDRLSRNDAESYVKYLPVSITGASPGDVLIGTKSQSLGAIVKVYEKNIPPNILILNGIYRYSDIWELLLTKLGSFPRYSSMTMRERRIHLLETASDKDIYFQDVPGLKFQLLNIGTEELTKTGTVKGDNRSRFLDLSDEEIKLLSSKPVSVSKIQNMFPSDPTSKGLKGRTTLIFRRGIWKIHTLYQEVEKFDGLCFVMDDAETNLEKGCHLENDKNNVIYTIKNFDGKRIAIKTNRDGILELSELIDLMLERFPKRTKKDVKIIQKACATFPPSAYKSFLQKIMRFRALKIDLGENVDHFKLPSDFVCCVVFLLLLTNKGSFVPDIQRFVRGSESALKRLVVTLIEDCYIPKKDEKTVLAILTGAFLSQRIQDWKPSTILIERCFDLIQQGLEDDRSYFFNITRGGSVPEFKLSSKNTTYQLISIMMSEIKTFRSDLDMIRDIVVNVTKDEISSSSTRPKIMPIEHMVDQHWAPELLYFADLDLIEKYREKGSKPFSKMMRKVFGQVTGVNPRREERKGRTMHVEKFVSSFEDLPFVKDVRYMQKLLLLSRQFTPIDRPVEEDEKIKFKYELDRGLITGMLGAHEIKVGRITTLVSLRPDNPDIVVAVKRPARNIKNVELDEKVEKEAKNILLNQLSHGLALNKIKAPVPMLDKAILTLRDGEYYIHSTAIRVAKKWDDVRYSSDYIYILSDSQKLDIEIAVRHTGEGQEQKARQRLKKLIEKTPISILQRVISHLQGQSQTVEFSRLSRDGGSTAEYVSPEDIGAYQFILKLTLLYPEAIKRIPSQTLKFETDLAPLLWKVRDIIKDETMKKMGVGKSKKGRWGKIYDRKKRELWEHQIDSVDDMVKAHDLGRRGHFIFIRAGMGKTMISLLYAQWLNDNGLLPKYIIFAIPPSAVATVLEECGYMGFKATLLIPLKTISAKLKKDYGEYIKQGCEPDEYHVNIIFHDHMRRCDELLPYMSESLFVMDEVHKALSKKTQRTAYALTFSLAAQEIVAMTGTPVINNNTYLLLPWLSQIVPFEVNDKNFWVAANSMIAKKAATGVKVIKRSRRVDFTPSEEKKYIDLVPPQLGGVCEYFSQKDFERAFSLSIQVATRGIIETAKKLLKKKIGVFIIAANNRHQQEIADTLKDERIAKEKDIFLIGKGNYISLTDQSVEKGITPDYKIVITTKQHAEGYNLTRLGAMITSVYFSNQATREQLEYRINRIGQTKTIYNYTIYAGLQYYTLQHHLEAASISAVFSTLADEFKMK
jgi:superfamily II DNA or RNA helicase